MLWLILGFFLPAGAAAGAITYSFNQDLVNGPAQGFSAFVGRWHIEKDGDGMVYAVDGRKWEQGLLAQGIVSKAKGLYGQRYAEFLDNLEAYKYFPLTICEAIDDFSAGTLSVRFKAISGRIDQAAGIAFAIKPNGDYLVVRANPLENNLVLFRMKRGHRSSVQWIRNVKTPSRIWHTLTVKLEKGKIQGLVDGKLFVDYPTSEDLSGRIGLWSKADSYVFFDDFKVRTNP